MTEYTPTTEQVRAAFWRDQCPPNDIDMDDIYNAGFDRWLARHEAQVKADAWDEGFEGGYFHGAYLKPRPTNPYREETR